LILVSGNPLWQQRAMIEFRMRCIELPEAMADWSLTSLQLKLIKIGARVVRHARAITFQLAEVAVTGPMVRAILVAIQRLRAPPLCASPRS
jgi:hypothetical protein